MASTLRDEVWSTETGLFGWNVQGVWPLYADGTDLNTAARSRNGQYVVTGGDGGELYLFSSPCIGTKVRKLGLPLQAPHEELCGHSSHVTRTRWLYDDSCILSTGGNDCSVMRWRVIPKRTMRDTINNEDSVFFTRSINRSNFGHSTRVDSRPKTAEESSRSGIRTNTYKYCPLRIDIGGVKSRIFRATKSFENASAEAKKQREHIEKTRIHKCCPMYPV
eukprot:PhM_4_TR11553/c0_g2_i1/m.32712